MATLGLTSLWTVGPKKLPSGKIVFFDTEGRRATTAGWKGFGEYYYYTTATGTCYVNKTIDGIKLDSLGRTKMSTMDMKAQGYSSNTNYLVLCDKSTYTVCIYKGSKGHWTRIKGPWNCTHGGSKGVLTEAWLDEQETTLILTESVYNQYQEIKAQSEILRQQAEEENAADADLPENARAIIREGREYIQTIHQYNDDIPGVEMSEKLYRLESTMDRIVEQVRQNPSSAPELRKLMSYYLPTTVKLLKAYKELDKQTVSGENITNTKQEIEDALDTINDAFENLLDSLFQNMAWDVSSDISVMQFCPTRRNGISRRRFSWSKMKVITDRTQETAVRHCCLL